MRVILIIMKKTTVLIFLISLFGFAMPLFAQTNEMIVHAKNIGAVIQPTMYGLFFEDVNFAADGGLYAEMIKNRSFEYPQHLQGWKSFGKVNILDDGPFDKNPYYVRLSDSGHEHKHSGLENEGFFGIGIKGGETYRFSVWARVLEKSKVAKIRIELVNPKSMEETQVIETQHLTIDSEEWKKYQVLLNPKKTNSKAVLRIFLEGKQTVDLEHISLFPIDTWKGRENGLRKDLVQLLADLKPGVFRFPGGCIVEGTDLKTRYNWKNSIGLVENRPLNESRWQYTFTHRFFPDYYQSYGLGFYDFFLLSEDIGAEPLPVLNCGLSCQFQNKKEQDYVSLDSLDAYIQDALDLIEFANGPITTKWGKIRAEMGHPESFNMKFIGIGNEQWGSAYTTRLEPFIKAIRDVYPDIKIIGGSGPNSEGEQFNYLWSEMKRLGVDLVDEHFYRSESWFLSQGTRYDSYDRKGPKVFAGEYACHGKGKKWNHFNAALHEAAFMTMLERNADIVHMASYAPLFAHVEGWQWRPDMIWFDNMNSFGTSSYYVQKLYALNKGTHVLKLTMNGDLVTGTKEQNGLFASAVFDENKNTIIVKVVNISSIPQLLSIKIEGMKKNDMLKGGRLLLLKTDDLIKENSLENPFEIVPEESELKVERKGVNVTIPPHAFAVYILQK